MLTLLGEVGRQWLPGTELAQVWLPSHNLVVRAGWVVCLNATAGQKSVTLPDLVTQSPWRVGSWPTYPPRSPVMGSSASGP